MHNPELGTEVPRLSPAWIPSSHPEGCRAGLKDLENGVRRGKASWKLTKHAGEQQEGRRATFWRAPS